MTQGSRKGGRIAAAFFLVLGLVFAGVVGWLVNSGLDFSRNAVSTSGIVVSVARERSSSAKAYTYRPTIRYSDSNGQSRTAQTAMSASSYNFAPGEKVAILVDSRDPSDMRIDSWFTLWGFGSIFAAVGLASLIGGVFVWRFADRPFVTGKTDGTASAKRSTANADQDASGPVRRS